ncbi:hypothetical protein [Sphingomicrobium aestuariivivum]|uniref:hypothetical protein n=1 Tax=Sphingomicrobium aestuariivivum TaxID=1582356 RepID=UPI001FD67D86|nr:hypothetical protein [Sphingomicrobium aestuariivivum]MCJ8191078.1 hypothetical protein [Sphingomicrobium aestuariivivum]
MAGQEVADAVHHPGYVHIPSAGTEGVRSYREPPEPHPAQLTFLTPEGEHGYVERLRGLLIDGRFDEAARILETDLAPFEGRIAKLCKATRVEDIVIEGWEDLEEIIAEFEGPPISAITAGLGNEPDLVFDLTKEHEPTLIFALYSDDMFDFSALSDEQLLDQCMSECPGWVGHEEDVEFYVNIEGLAPLNTALIQCKHIHFLRDGRDGVEGRAPGGYVEYQLGCWLRATRFLQAIDAKVKKVGLPKGVRLITGLIGMNADLATLLGQRKAPAAPSMLAQKGGAKGSSEDQFATLTMKKWVPKHDPLADMESGSSLRQRIAASEEEAPAPQPAPTPAPAPVASAPSAQSYRPQPQPQQPAEHMMVSAPVAPPATAPDASVFDPRPAPEPAEPARPRGGFLKRLFQRRRKKD